MTGPAPLRIALAQYDFLVGDIQGNLDKALGLVGVARESGADLLLFPEMALSGYPPEDLLLRPGFLESCHEAMERFAAGVSGIDVVFGHPWAEQGRRYNAVSWIRDGRVLGRYFKKHLPNYLVFDEHRYFSEGGEPLVVDIKGVRVGVIICEDAWEAGPAVRAKEAGAELLLIPNASPYRDNKQQDRLALFADRFAETGLPVVYCNLVGGQDELVFDGRSMLMDSRGEISEPGPLCEEALLLADYNHGGTLAWLSSGSGFSRDEKGYVKDRFSDPERPIAAKAAPTGTSASPAEIYKVIVTGLRDYVRKNGFSDVVFGLSGGIDSSLVLALAVDALGPDHVHTVMMPSRHTSGLSIELAQEQALQLGVDHRCISIEPAYEAFLTLLGPSFAGVDEDVTEENLQARARGNLIMALSNKFGWLPITTSNKSELAVGYCTIYGDMCGGFGPLLDCSKMRVYELSRYRNTLSAAIPENVINRPPSAELRPDQQDQDSLPPYDVLDQVLQRYVEQDWSVEDIIADGFDAQMVHRIARLVLINEYKRRQGPPGVRITHRAFGRDRRYPITSGWRNL
ncbi:MAG: NAD+ synthase [Xanthomonadales bacterium]|jgi:NAD+ synthase (glutamine-hydrolysing)|nr:NAD+ synthase [Xanthomonadales bacterium]